MHKQLEQNREIAPDEWLTPPVNYALQPTKEILDSNAQAANMMNKAKMIFIGRCLYQIFPQEQVGEAELEHLNKPEMVGATLLDSVDLAQLCLTITPQYEKPLVSAAEAKLLGKDQIYVRKASDLLELRYQDRLLGILTYEYETGNIRITAEIDDQTDRES